MDKRIVENEGAFVDLLNQEMKELQESQKQIEEMKTHIKSALSGVLEIEIDKLAEELIKYYQPKITEGAVVLTREELDDMKFTKEYCNLYKENQWLKKCLRFMRRTTAEKFAERLKKVIHERDYVEGYAYLGICEEIDEIAKEITEGMV